MAYAEEDAERIFQTAIIGIAFLIGAAATIAITGPAVLDSNPASYIIVTMLMGVLFVFFTLKDPSPVTKGDYSMIAATLLFVVYLILLSYARGALSFGFLSYRMDALLLPLLLLSIVVAISGIKGVKRYVPVMVYLLFASPIILFPLLVSNGGLSSFSASVVYSIMKAVGVPVVQSGLQIVAPSGQAIQIASTCVPIGTFVAFLMFLIPVSYLYTGRMSRRALWLVSGLVLFFILNILRMMIIALVWAHSGLGSAIATFHTIGGAVIFYLAIVLMLLIHRSFGLELNWGKNWGRRLRMAFDAYDIESDYAKAITAAIIALAVLSLSIGYASSPNVSATTFNATSISNSTYLQLYAQLLSKLNASKVSYSYVETSDGTVLFELGGGSAANASTYLAVSFYPYLEHGGNMFSYSAELSRSGYLLRNGITITSLVANSSNESFFVNYFALPMTVKGSAFSANFEIFSAMTPNAPQYCNPADGSGIESYLESGIYDLISYGNPYHGAVLCYAEKIALT